MDPKQILHIVDSLHREKSIPKEIVFQAIEAALVSAAKRHFGEEADITFQINRDDGRIHGQFNGAPLDYEDVIGRIGAQTAKQVIIQKVREAERDVLLEEYSDQIGQLITGAVQRNEGSVTTVALGTLEAILPRTEQIPGETHHAGQRIRAVVYEVKPQGTRVKVVLSRTRPELVERLFEQEIPEIADGVISINGIAREPGHRAKVAVSSTDQRVDCVGACVGVRGNRIKNILDELAGERIDIIPYDSDPQNFIRKALQPAEVEEVILCQMLGRAIVLVRDDQLSLAIGRKGQNVRLASKLCGWDIEIMTQEDLEGQIERAVQGFSAIEGVTEELANRLVGEGYLSYDDLSVIEPDDLMEMGGLTLEDAQNISDQAEEKALELERAEAAERERQRELERQGKLPPDARVVGKRRGGAALPTKTEPPREAPGPTSAAETSRAEGAAETASAEGAAEASEGGSSAEESTATAENLENGDGLQENDEGLEEGANNAAS